MANGQGAPNQNDKDKPKDPNDILTPKEEKEVKKTKKAAHLRKIADALYERYNEAAIAENNLRIRATAWRKWVKGIDHERSTRELGIQYNPVSPGDLWAYWTSPKSLGGTIRTNMFPFPDSAYPDVDDLESYRLRGLGVLSNIEKRLPAAEKKKKKRMGEYNAALQEWADFTGTTFGQLPDWAKDIWKPDPVISGSGGGGGGDGDGDDTETGPTLKAKDARKISFNYNIPMVKSSYFQNHQLQRDQLLSLHPNWSIKDNGRNMWFGADGGKGVIQADLQNASSPGNQEWKSSRNIKNKLDNILYGFRFLYNPNAVNMSWAINNEVAPQGLGLGLDKAIPMATNTASASMSFSVMLNRIEDMSHVDRYGWRRKELTPGYFDTNTHYGVYPTFDDTNPWPTIASPLTFNADLKDIYRRGTLYDLDFLFAALMPHAPKYKSTLNGVMADRSFLSGVIVEIHLGPGMRYRGQINSLSVDHIIFNERMVPILSEVQFSITRVIDYQRELKATSSKYGKNGDGTNKKKKEKEKDDTK